VAARCLWVPTTLGELTISTYNLETHSSSLELGGIALSHFGHISLSNIMGSLGPTRAMNGNPVGNGSAPVNGDSPAAANGGHLEPIAVVGMSCRLSGDASDTQKLWELLIKGRSAWSKTPKDRFNQEAFHDPSAEGKPGRVRTYHISARQSGLGPIQNVQLTTYSLDKYRRWTFSER
jgi:hypothetical protein